MKNSIVFRKNGGFYCVYGDDAFILYYLLGYKIIDDKVGFPIKSIDKIVGILNDKCISYELNDEFINYKKRNNYSKFVSLGKKRHSLDYRINDIISKLNNLDERKIDLIINYIESLL